MWVIEMPFGHAASQAPVFVHAPKSSFSIAVVAAVLAGIETILRRR